MGARAWKHQGHCNTSPVEHIRGPIRSPARVGRGRVRRVVRWRHAELCCNESKESSEMGRADVDGESIVVEH